MKMGIGTCGTLLNDAIRLAAQKLSRRPNIPIFLLPGFIEDEIIQVRSLAHYAGDRASHEQYLAPQPISALV
jgi:hypothetical protein